MVTRERRPRSFAPVINEILLAAGPVPLDPSAQPYGNDIEHMETMGMLASGLASDGTASRTDELLFSTFLVACQVPPEAIRTALVSLAGAAVAWIYDIDARTLPEVAA